MYKKILVTLISLLVVGEVLAIDRTVEILLFRQALVSSTDNQKTLDHFYKSIAKEKRKEAEKLREIMSLGFGGKFMTEYARKKELLRQAEILENEATSYEGLIKQ